MPFRRVRGEWVAELAPAQFGKLKSIPGAFWTGAEWHLVDSPYTFLDVERVFPNEPYSSGFKHAIREAHATLARLNDPVPAPTKTLLPLRPHQEDAYRFAYPRRGTLLALDMGTGKTAVAISLILQRQHRHVLIVSPKSCMDVWPKELAKFSPTDYHPLVLRTHATAAKKSEYVRRYLAAKPGERMVVVNYETLWRMDGLEDAFDCLIMDECDYVKNAESQANQFLYNLQVPWRMGLTGTPNPNGPFELFGQFKLLDPGVFGVAYSRFEQTYGIVSNDPFHHVVGYKDMDTFKEKVASITIQVKRRDVLKHLPPVEHVIRTGEFADRRPYDQLKDEFVTYVKENVVDGTLALPRLLRLEQLTSGFVQTGPDSYERWDYTKMNLLREVLAHVPQEEKSVVFCRFRPDLDAVQEVCTELGIACGEVSGEKNQLVNATYPAHFRCMAVQMRAGGRGVDLTPASYGVYYSTGFSGGDFEQTLARQDRDGQTKPVTYYHLHVYRTVDQRKYRALLDKQDAAEAILSLARRGAI